jgi:hypothetical protein
MSINMNKALSFYNTRHVRGSKLGNLGLVVLICRHNMENNTAEVAFSVKEDCIWCDLECAKWTYELKIQHLSRVF